MADRIVLDQVLIDAYRKPAITAYNRLEGSPRTAEFDRSLKAEIRDPLWMLTRQWQFGEFKGEDAASAVTTQIEREQTLMNQVKYPDSAAFNYDGSEPLETVVERERLKANLYLSVRCAGYFIKLLWKDSLYDAFVSGALRANYGLGYTVNDNDTDGKQLHVAVTGSTFDGFAVIKDIETVAGSGTVFSEWVNSSGLPAGMISCGERLLAWYRRMYSQPSTDNIAWLPSQLEYSFTATGGADKLIAEQYSEGRLDWYSFDHEHVPPPAGRILENPEPVSFIPASVSFKGMPNPRFWMMEDSKTDFGKMDTTPTGLLHLLLAEFGLIYSNDWFILPYPLTTNSICELKNIVVTDTFGQLTLVRPAGHSTESNWQQWSLFHQTERNIGATNGRKFYLAPVITNYLESPPVEEVNFLRDEMANLVWGVEVVVPSQSGKGMRGSEMAIPVERPAVVTPPGNEDTNDEDKPKIKYKAGTAVPDNWTPFIPVHLEGSISEIRLQRAKMPLTKGPYGVLLKEKQAPYYINEEEIGRSGVLVQRNWQYTRWYGGKRFLWMARWKSNSKGEGIAMLEFDQVKDV